MKAIIIDDEQSSREVLRLLLEYYPDVEITGEAAGVSEGLALLELLSPDVVFLDIQLQTETGFELLDKFSGRRPEVVMVTSYDQHAIRAIRYRVFDYLLKPIDLDDLEKTINKLRAHLEAAQANSRTTPILIPVHNGNVVRMLPPEEICYIVADGAYSILYTEDHSYTTSRTLQYLEDMLKECGKFIRISRKMLINARFIRHYSKGECFAITMKNDETFEVSRRRKASILRLLEGKHSGQDQQQR